MSDNEEPQLLSRRERRMREMAATGAVPVVSPAPEAGTGDAAGAAGADEIVISPVDEQGRPRTRREMRELREQALAERAAQMEQETAAEPEPRDENPAPVAADDVVDSEPSGDLSMTQTQPFTREDLEAATAASDAEADLDDEADLEDEVGEPVAADTVPMAAVRPVSGAAPTQGYTFPDIAPLDEGISVFDDPASRTASEAGSTVDPGEGADFDSFISRAVAQEGAASASSSSALILPTMPESADLAGPLGETGELYITGSIELPRSLGETGGHAALLDSVEADPLDEIGITDRPASESGIAPVSAARAVSARATLGPVVTESQKEKSKLPVVLIATGGGLVVAVVALLIWGATSGMFG